MIFFSLEPAQQFRLAEHGPRIVKLQTQIDIQYLTGKKKYNAVRLDSAELIYIKHDEEVILCH